MTIHEHLRQTRAICESATPGPYYYAIDPGEPERYYNAIWSNSRPNPHIANMVMDDPDAEKNVAFFAHARTALPLFTKALEVAVMGIDGEIGAASCCGRTTQYARLHKLRAEIESALEGR